MIARSNGQVVLVAGAIPGETVTAKIDRVRKGVAYAETETIDDPSTDRRTPFADPLCGGCLYAHIAYPRQLEIKSQVIADGFARIGRMVLPSAVQVVASRDDGYRMRARLHRRGGRIGFFREGTHELCNARSTRQLLPSTCEVLDRLDPGLQPLVGDGSCEIELSENVDASHRVVALDLAASVDSASVEALAAVSGLTGVSVGKWIAGDPHVVDVMAVDGHEVQWRRHVASFFQGNRYLLHDLVTAVATRIDPASRVLDLYAGAGLFAIAAAVVRGAEVTAVEGDAFGARDLKVNAAQARGAVRAVHQAVEIFLARRTAVDTVVVDPPRTGLSREALDGIIRLRSRRVVYVGCDVATLARDARHLVDAGYALSEIEAFDLFPNTPHVEVIAAFQI
jgi:23S rRNA (uracil1939-C5)-methyltransferase